MCSHVTQIHNCREIYSNFNNVWRLLLMFTMVLRLDLSTRWTIPMFNWIYFHIRQFCRTSGILKIIPHFRCTSLVSGKIHCWLLYIIFYRLSIKWVTVSYDRLFFICSSSYLNLYLLGYAATNPNKLRERSVQDTTATRRKWNFKTETGYIYRIQAATTTIQ